MRRTNFIALDVHNTFCEGGYIDDAGREKSVCHEPTSIPELVKFIDAVTMRTTGPLATQRRCRGSALQS
jgi:hypothetical protein